MSSDMSSNIGNNPNINANLFASQGIGGAPVPKPEAGNIFAKEDGQALSQEDIQKMQKEIEEKLLADVNKKVQEFMKTLDSGSEELSGSKEEFNELIQDMPVEKVIELYKQQGITPQEDVQLYIDKFEGKETKTDNTKKDEEGIDLNVADAGVDTQ